MRDFKATTPIEKNKAFNVLEMKTGKQLLKFSVPPAQTPWHLWVITLKVLVQAVTFRASPRDQRSPVVRGVPQGTGEKFPNPTSKKALIYS